MSSKQSTTFTGNYAEDFEIWSEFYDSSVEIEALKKHSNLSDKDLFEVGCGSGRLTFRLADSCQSVVAVDIVPSLIDLCQRRLAQKHSDLVSQLRFEVQDATSVAYPEDHFDALLDGWTFSIFEDKKGAAEEYKRISKSGAPFYAIQVREGSEYQNILDMFIPDEKLEEWSDDEDLDVQMKRLFGEPEVEKDLITPYYFDSVDEAFNAYMFNFEEWLDMELTDSEQAELRTELEGYEENGVIRIEEYAQFFKFYLNEE